MTHWFPDNSVIVNFAHLDRLELLRGYLRGSGRVVQAVEREIANSASFVPQLDGFDIKGWFGKAIRVTRDAERQMVEGIRRHRFGGDPFKPREHLGESETLFIIQSRENFRDSVWITEDGDAFRFGKKQGIVTRNTFDVLCDRVGAGELSADEAFDCMNKLHKLDRHLIYHPGQASEFC